MSTNLLKIFILLIFSVFIYNDIFGQKKIVDPAGFVKKYNPSFNGIGPTVYLLPAPRTRIEILEDSYQDKKSFRDTIKKELIFHELISQFEHLPASKIYHQDIREGKISLDSIQQIIQQDILAENFIAAYNLLNEAARLYLKNKDIQHGIELLLDALMHVQKTSNQDDFALIQKNLSIAYLIQKQFNKSMDYQNQYYQYTILRKNNIEQANSIVNQAFIEASKGNYAVAENSIIRKAIPLLNKHDGFSEKIEAWKQLANIYQIQNKHAEAQWFLIQAKDLANGKKLTNELAEIEFMLAYSKWEQKNYLVAQNEFLNAKSLAMTEDNKLLALAIEDKIGDIHMLLHQYDKAEQSLKDYWNLRNQLF